MTALSAREVERMRKEYDPTNPIHSVQFKALCDLALDGLKLAEAQARAEVLERAAKEDADKTDRLLIEQANKVRQSEARAEALQRELDESERRYMQAVRGRKEFRQAFRDIKDAEKGALAAAPGEGAVK